MKFLAAPVHFGQCCIYATSGLRGCKYEKFKRVSRVINEWNMLSEEIIAGNSISGFKRTQDWETSGDLYKLNLAFFTVFDQQNYAVLLSESKKWVPWLLSVVLFCVSLRLVILLQHRLVTDGQTDRRIDCALSRLANAYRCYQLIVYGLEWLLLPKSDVS